MALETKTTSFQRLYPGLAGVRSVFSICHFWGGQASLKSRVGQGGSLFRGFKQKLKVAEWLLPPQGKGLGSAPWFGPECPSL